MEWKVETKSGKGNQKQKCKFKNVPITGAEHCTKSVVIVQAAYMCIEESLPTFE